MTNEANALPDGVTVVRVTAHYEAKINLGNYESATVSHFMDAEVDQAIIAPAAAANALMEQCKRAVRVAAVPLIAKRDQKIDSVWQGLPEHVRKSMEDKF